MSKFNICKIDSKLGVIIGWANVSSVNGIPLIDRQSEVVPPDALTRAAFKFAKGKRVAKINHEGPQQGEVLWIMPITADIAKAVGIQSRNEGLLVGIHFDDPEIFKAFENGQLASFSIGGSVKASSPFNPNQSTTKGNKMTDNQPMSKAAAESQLEALAKSYAAREQVTKEQAMEKVLQTPQGSRLYSQYINGE